MSDQPFRERRIPPEEVQRIVQRALELAAMDGKLTDGKALTGAELEARLQELGVSPEIARRALEPKIAVVAPSVDGVVRIVREVELEDALSPEHFERVADAIQAVMKVPGRVSAVGSKLTWMPGGAMLEPSVTVSAKEGRTVIRYIETFGSPRHMKIAFGALSGFAALGSSMTVFLGGAAIAHASGISAASGVPIVLGIAALMGMASAIGSFRGLKRSAARRFERRSRFADDVMAAVTQAVEASLTARGNKTRIESSSVAEAESETEAELTEDDRAVARRDVERRGKAR